MKRLKGLWPLGIALAAGLTIPLFRLHFFHTESAPIGLWRALPAAQPDVGDVARFCMRPEEARLTAGRPYAGGRRGGPCPHDTWMLAKPVVAAAGDTVVHTPDAVRVNGRALPRSSTRTHDARGLPVPVAEYRTFVLEEGEFWMHSPYADGSFDSRYLGVVRRDQLRGTMRPMVTWLTPDQHAALCARGLRPERCGLVACVQREHERILPTRRPHFRISLIKASTAAVANRSRASRRLRARSSSLPKLGFPFRFSSTAPSFSRHTILMTAP